MTNQTSTHKLSRIPRKGDIVRVGTESDDYRVERVKERPGFVDVDLVPANGMTKTGCGRRSLQHFSPRLLLATLSIGGAQ